MNRKTSKSSFACKMKSPMHKKSKRKSANSASVKKNNTLTKNLKKHSNHSSKAGRKSFHYEYQIKSRLTWEFADVFRDTESWDESIKGGQFETQPLKVEPVLTNNIEDKILVDKSLNENINFDQQNGNTLTIKDKAIATPRFVTSRSIVIEHPLGEDVAETAEEGAFSMFDNLIAEDLCNDTNLKKHPLGEDVVETAGPLPTHTRDFSVACQLKTGEPTSKTTANSGNICSIRDTLFSPNPSLQKYQKRRSEEKPYSCTQCAYTSSSKRDLTRHMRTHTGEKPYSCTQCSFSSSRKGNLTVHMLTHSGEKPYECSQCSYSCSYKSSLTVHMRTHSGEKPYSCSQCAYTCSRQSSLTVHMHTHSGEKPYSCSHCSYSCSQQGSLTVHMRTHSGEKPYSCSQCPYSCSTKSYLTKHICMHSGGQPYSCDQCSYSCSRKSHLTRHIRTHSGKND